MADVKLVVAICRAKLDTFLARESITVAATRREGIKIGKLGNIMGLSRISQQ